MELAARFSVVRLAQAGDPNIVLLPGLFGGAWIWSEVIERLRAEGGFGISVFEEPFAKVDCLGKTDLPSVTSHIRAALDDARISGPVVLCGNSFGALVALHLAVTDPGTVAGIVVSGMPGFAPEPDIPLGIIKNKSEFVRLLGPKLFHDMDRLPQEHVDDAYELFRHWGTLRNLLRAIRASHRCDATRLLSRLTVPALFSWGEYDQMTPKGNLPALLAGHPLCRFEIVPEAGHSPMVEAPAVFSEQMLGFLRQRFGSISFAADVAAMPALEAIAGDRHVVASAAE